MSQDVIELNGKRYDAITGAYLGKSHVVPQHISERYMQGKVIDGVVRRPRPTHASSKAAKTAEQPKVQTKPDAQSVVKPSRTPATHAKGHQPEHAKTLKHRHARKPEFSLKPTIKVQAPAEVMAKPASAIAHKRSAYSIDPSRKQRAVATNRHHAIKHFSTPAAHSVPAHVPTIAVHSTPLHLTTRPAPPVHPKAQPDIFETAMARASSHEQPQHKIRRQRNKHRLTNSLAIIGTFLVIGGFVGYLNLPGIQLKVASMHAGFGASMPNYTPTGYALEGGVQQTGGIIALQFRSGESKYRITQQSSNWNSQTLLDSTLALNGKHQTVQKNGQTIYIYENEGTSAAWVSGGVRYDITGNAQLSEDEIASIASSL